MYPLFYLILVLIMKGFNNMKTYRDFDNYLKNFPDEKGYFGEYGGMILPPELVPAFKEITQAYMEICKNARFINELRRIRKEFQGRPTPVYHCERLSSLIGKCQIYLKREDLNHTGAHKLNHCMGEGLLAKFLGKKKLIAETGAGQHGVALALAVIPCCAKKLPPSSGVGISYFYLPNV